MYINMHTWKTHILLDLFAKNTACMRAEIHVGLLLDLSAKDAGVKLMYINMYFSCTLGIDSY